MERGDAAPTLQLAQRGPDNRPLTPWTLVPALRVTTVCAQRLMKTPPLCGIMAEIGVRSAPRRCQPARGAANAFKGCLVATLAMRIHAIGVVAFILVESLLIVIRAVPVFGLRLMRDHSPLGRMGVEYRNDRGVGLPATARRISPPGFGCSCR
jgi:hypothetical protein